MILNCVIIDDEPIARKLLQEYIEETDFLRLVGTAENPLKIAGLIQEHQADLVFLDINMPKMTGLEFLRSAKNLPMVIMTTAYGQYALEGFELDVIDYLVKPFSLERFLKACHKAHEFKLLRSRKQLPDKAGDEYFFVKSNGKIERVAFDDLIYVEALTNYVTLHTVNGKLVTYLTIKGLMESLPAGKFIQVHKSFIINTDKVKTIDGNTINLPNASITIGQSFRDEVMKRILKDKFLKR
ncbi:MAG: response regulator transcription factor [Bacteroidetes bacterium]|nr:response regulator transcription factor [Bacteroidota bacterium]